MLLDALAMLPARDRLRIVGEGPERERLAARIAALGLADRATLCGARAHHQLPLEYASAQVVVVPSVTDATGDRDGLPNVVLEAMASGRPVVASDAGAIASAVHHGRTGLLVPPRHPLALAASLRTLAAKPQLRHRLGDAAREFVEERYDLPACAERFCRALEVAYA